MKRNDFHAMYYVSVNSKIVQIPPDKFKYRGLDRQGSVVNKFRFPTSNVCFGVLVRMVMSVSGNLKEQSLDCIEGGVAYNSSLSCILEYSGRCIFYARPRFISCCRYHSAALVGSDGAAHRA